MGLTDITRLQGRVDRLERTVGELVTVNKGLLEELHQKRADEAAADNAVLKQAEAEKAVAEAKAKTEAAKAAGEAATATKTGKGGRKKAAANAAE